MYLYILYLYSIDISFDCVMLKILSDYIISRQWREQGDLEDLDILQDEEETSYQYQVHDDIRVI